jgi:hypothetical protein
MLGLLPWSYIPNPPSIFKIIFSLFVSKIKVRVSEHQVIHFLLIRDFSCVCNQFEFTEFQHSSEDREKADSSS